MLSWLIFDVRDEHQLYYLHLPLVYTYFIRVEMTRKSINCDITRSLIDVWCTHLTIRRLPYVNNNQYENAGIELPCTLLSNNKSVCLNAPRDKKQVEKVRTRVSIIIPWSRECGKLALMYVTASQTQIQQGILFEIYFIQLWTSTENWNGLGVAWIAHSPL